MQHKSLFSCESLKMLHRIVVVVGMGMGGSAELQKERRDYIVVVVVRRFIVFRGAQERDWCSFIATSRHLLLPIRFMMHHQLFYTSSLEAFIVIILNRRQLLFRDLCGKTSFLEVWSHLSHAEDDDEDEGVIDLAESVFPSAESTSEEYEWWWWCPRSSNYDCRWRARRLVRAAIIRTITMSPIAGTSYLPFLRV